MITWSVVDPRSVGSRLSISLSISFAMAQSSHNSEIDNIVVHCAVVTREPRNRDNGASDVWALTAYTSKVGSLYHMPLFFIFFIQQF